MISRIELKADRITLRFSIAEAQDIAISVDSARRKLPGSEDYMERLREVLHGLYQALVAPDFTEHEVIVPMLSPGLHKETPHGT